MNITNAQASRLARELAEQVPADVELDVLVIALCWMLATACKAAEDPARARMAVHENIDKAWRAL